jgi:hypothetical protein
MPRGPSGGDSSTSATKKNKRGLGSMLKKSWTMQDCKHLDALIARVFYSGGMHYACKYLERHLCLLVLILFFLVLILFLIDSQVYLSILQEIHT